MEDIYKRKYKYKHLEWFLINKKSDKYHLLNKEEKNIISFLKSSKYLYIFENYNYGGRPFFENENIINIVNNNIII